MGKMLAEYYKKAFLIGGMQARVKLAYLTKMGSAQADEAPDTSSNIALFEQSLHTITETLTQVDKNLVSNQQQETDKYNKAYLETISKKTSLIHNRELMFRKITEVTGKTLEVARSSIWLYDNAKTMIRCHDLYVQKTEEHLEGLVLMAKDFKQYFEALEREKTIAAEDAHSDPRTSVFSENYLTPLGISSMLDVPIWVNGKMRGVLCNEHIGTKRKWQPEEEDFAYKIASLSALSLETL